jgi:hypothetical protein
MLIGKLSRPWRRMTRACNLLMAAWRRVLKELSPSNLRDRHGLEQAGYRNRVAAALANAMFHHSREYCLHVFRYDRIASQDQGPGARGTQ